MRILVMCLVALLLGCAELPQQANTPSLAMFDRVATRVTPEAEKLCRQQTRNVSCEFLIVVDTDPRAPANAFQSLSQDGQPVLTFSLALIEEMQNDDELAFVIGHEAAHHIAGHLYRQQRNAEVGADKFAELEALQGGSQADVESARELGAAVGARSYSKEFELEADAVGTVITHLAGYDPVLGAAYFSRIPDPGNRFLGSHPPNAARVEIVRQTASRL